MSYSFHFGNHGEKKGLIYLEPAVLVVLMKYSSIGTQVVVNSGLHLIEEPLVFFVIGKS